MRIPFDLPKVAVVIDANTFTRKLVEASGRDLDKFAHAGLGTFPATVRSR